MRGSRGLAEATAKKYARAFRVSVAWLLTGHGDPKQFSNMSLADQRWAALDEEQRALALRLLDALRPS